MKRLAVITTSLLMSLAAFGGTAALADEAQTSETYYPENFIKALTFSDLKDYDIENGAYYFLDGETYYKFEDGELTHEEREQFSAPQTTVTVNNGNYTYRLADSVLKVWDKDDVVTPFDGEYSLLKEFGDKAYAVKDNVLYSFGGAEPTAVPLDYVDYSVTQSIKVGQTAEKLKNRETLTFVTLTDGAYMTAIDLISLDGEYFELENTEADVSVNTVTVKSENEGAVTALLLCYTGNAAIVSIGDSSYVTLKSATTERTDINCYTPAEYANATITGNRIYASPFTVIGTTLLPEATGTIVTVKNKIEYAGVLNSTYYEVEYGPEDDRKTGYVAEGFLTEYIIEDNKEPDTVPDPDFNESTRVTTVLLILAVVVLVLIALGYVVYTATSGRKKKDKKDKPEIEEEK